MPITKQLDFTGGGSRAFPCLPFWNYDEVINQRKLAFNQKEKRMEHSGEIEKVPNSLLHSGQSVP